VDPLNTLLKEQETLVKLHYNDTTKLEKEMNTVYANLKKMKEIMLGKLKAIEVILYSCEDFRNNPKQAEVLKSDPEIKDRMNFKMGNGLREYKEALDKYKSYYAYTKNYKDQYKSSMKIMMKAYQKLAEDRIQILKDSLQKLIIFEASMNQNNKYDVDQVGKVIFAIDVPQTITSLIQAHTKDINQTKLSITPIELPNSPWAPLFELYEHDYCGKEIFMDYELIVEETKTHIIKSKDGDYKKYYQELKIILTSVFSNSFEAKSTKRVIEVLEEKKGRLAFYNIVKEFAESGNLKLQSESYKALATSAFIFLDKCYLDVELELIYKLIEIVNKISLIDTDSTLLYAIKTHEIWSDMKFWQTVIKNELDANIRIQRRILLTEYQKSSSTNTLLEK